MYPCAVGATGQPHDEVGCWPRTSYGVGGTSDHQRHREAAPPLCGELALLGKAHHLHSLRHSGTFLVPIYSTNDEGIFQAVVERNATLTSYDVATMRSDSGRGE